MATLTLTIPDAVVPRIRAAYGRRDINNPAIWINATVAEVEAAVKAQIKERVINHETTLAAETERATRSAEAW